MPSRIQTVYVIYHKETGRLVTTKSDDDTNDFIDAYMCETYEEIKNSMEALGCDLEYYSIKKLLLTLVVD